MSEFKENLKKVKDARDNKTKEPEPEPEEAVPVLKVICKTNGGYIYKDVKRGTSFTETILIRNDHKGLLKGQITSDAEWLVPERKYFVSEDEQTLGIHIVTANIPVNTYDAQGTITLITNGGFPYPIFFRVVLAGLEIVVGRFRKTYVAVAAACAGSISSFSSLSFIYCLVNGIAAGTICFFAAKVIVKVSLKHDLNPFKFPSVLMQSAAGGLAILTILSHSSLSSIIKQEIEPERFGITVRQEKTHVLAATQPEQLQTPIRRRDDFEAVDSKARYGFGCGNNGDGQCFSLSVNKAGTEAIGTSPDRVTGYFLCPQDWHFVHKCFGMSPCIGSPCAIATVPESKTLAQNVLNQSSLAETLAGPNRVLESGKTLRANMRSVSNRARKKKWKPKMSSFAPPSRDDL